MTMKSKSPSVFLALTETHLPTSKKLNLKLNGNQKHVFSKHTTMTRGSASINASKPTGPGSNSATW